MPSPREQDATRIERAFKRLIKGPSTASEAFNLLDELMELRPARLLPRAAALYRLALPRSGERTSKHGVPGERFLEPPRSLAPLVARDVYPYLRPFLPVLREHNNVWAVGAALAALVTGADAKAVGPLLAALTEGLSGYTDEEVADFVEAMTVLELDDEAEARRKAILKAGLPAVLATRSLLLTSRP